MEEQNKQNFEKQDPKEKEEIKEAKQNTPNFIPKNAIIIGAIAVAVVAIAIVIIVLLAGNGKSNNNNNTSDTSNNSTHTHSYGEWEITKDSTFVEKGSKTRECSCGATETLEIPKKQPENTTLNAIDCLNELNIVYLNSFSQKTVWFEEDDWIDARYYDGTESYAYFSSEKDGETKNKWYGKINGSYYYLEERITSSENKKTYEDINGLEVSSAVENAGDGFQYLEYAINLIEEASTFSCQKTTDENGEKYILKLIVDGDYENITISVVNGLITVYDHEDYTKATYLYDKVITMPTLTDFNIAN